MKFILVGFALLSGSVFASANPPPEVTSITLITATHFNHMTQ
ncbi:hypothetical protein PISS_a1874 [Pseudoalteromonas issachenkonii]|uniref:Uncharacterized protein n=1 Tax=Pseudoalteromonas issachenkonii TaxID=152297 RepID=A0ABM6N3S7_9GAMM|nr:hypothetical protein [Pseudoalteromonas issachenkonii]ATC90749.1 hypothetical protein PISS_a1874 [Pseudoalteromonas issachenkonii]